MKANESPLFIHSYLLTWVLLADLQILHQKTDGLLSLRFHTANVGMCLRLFHSQLGYDSWQDRGTLVVVVLRKDVTSGEIVTTPRFPRPPPPLTVAAAFLSWRANILPIWFFFCYKFLDVWFPFCAVMYFVLQDFLDLLDCDVFLPLNTNHGVSVISTASEPNSNVVVKLFFLLWQLASSHLLLNFECCCFV